MGRQSLSAVHSQSGILKNKLTSIRFFSIVYRISVGLVAVKYLSLMGVIYMIMKKIYVGLGIAVPVIVVWFFHMTNRAHPCCIHLEDYIPTFRIVGS